MWQISPETWDQWRKRGRDVAYAILFVVAVGLIVGGGLTLHLELIGSGLGLLAVIGIGKA